MNMNGDGGAIAPMEMAMQKNQLRTRRSKLPRRKRAGSVMIMVVALLVLMALMGTAWIATVRTDRGASAANVANTQSEMLLQGLKEITTAKVGIDSVYDTKGNWRPKQEYDNSGLPVFSYVDAIYPLPESNGIVEKTDHANEFLASRVPQLAPAQLGSLNVQAYWPAISAPLLPGPDDPVTARRASAATELTSEFVFTSPVPSTKNGRTQYRDRTLAYPTVIELTRNGMTETHPALTFDGDDAFLAADADGDGVADAGLWRLPLGQQNGITWFAAVRIIDNNSAINATVASDWDDSASPRPGQFFPSNISLRSLLRAGGGSTPASQLAKLNDHRFGVQSVAVGTPALKDDGSSAGFNWVSVEDALWMQLGRRLENPGATGGGGVKARALDLTDQFSLSSRFIFDDRELVSKLEDLTWPTLIGRTRKDVSYGQTPASIKDWYDQNFDYAATDYNRRPLIVTRNTVSNHAQYARNAADPASIFVPTAISLADKDPSLSAAEKESIKSTPIHVKASLNTGTFAQLWLAYWNTMIDRANPTAPNPAWSNKMLDGDTTPFARVIDANPSLLADAGTARKDTYWGVEFNAGTGDPIVKRHPWRMFRSSIRDIGGNGRFRFEPDQQLLLRSAIAAQNTVQMRNRYPAGSFKNINLRASIDDTPDQRVQVTIYGIQPQPYITEVYVNNNARRFSQEADLIEDDWNKDKGYVAIELYNPHLQAINMGGWRLAAVNRTAYDSGKLKIAWETTLPAGTTIPGRSYLVLENIKPGEESDKGLDTPPATKFYRPRAAGTMTGTPRHIEGLESALNNELVLLRPGEGDTLQTMCPVDHFDFTGLTLAMGTNTAKSWHYSRETQAGNPQWRFVYPGRYVGDATSKRQQGTDESAEWDPAIADDSWDGSVPAPGMSLGRASLASHEPSVFTIQIATDGAPNPDGGQYPFGAFGRVGDIMHVPFIGAYVVKRGNDVIEMNAVTMDSVFAEDTDDANDELENIGRFCPTWPGTRNLTQADWDNSDFNANPLNSQQWRYRWAMKIFDYFTVFTPDDDYLPNAARPATGTLPNPVKNTRGPGAANDPDERLAGVEGLININTAPWKVIATLPLLPAPATNQPAIDILAQEIVADREVNGPFRSVFDLYRVPRMRLMLQTVFSAGFNANTATGELSTDGVHDFEEDFLLLNGISNLITTRSDTFTAYLLIQGWRGVNSDQTPELVAQRRIGVFIDRNRVRTNRSDVKTYIFPVE